MSKLTLFTDPRFPCPQRLRLVILELGLEITDTHYVNIIKREQRKEEFLKINPSGAVPCIQDHSYDPVLILSESRAIARYLASQYGKSNDKLIPDDDVVAKAKFEEAASIELTSFDATANRLAFEAHFKQVFMKQDPNEEVVEELKARLEKSLVLLDHKLSDKSFMTGETITLVDFFYVPYMHQLEANVWPTFLDGRQNLLAWWNRMKGRESYRQVYQDRGNSLTGG